VGWRLIEELLKVSFAQSVSYLRKVGDYVFLPRLLGISLVLSAGKPSVDTIQ
jgi:hypothetical protein